MNRLTNMLDAVGTTAHTYDLAGRMLTEDGPWSSDTVTYTYTNGLRWTLALQQPSGSYTQVYWYDSTKRLTNTTATSGTFGYGYHAGASRQVKSLALPNTAVITNAYDPIGRWTKTHLRTSGGTLLNGHGYQYDAGHRRTKQTYSNASYVNYGYDRTDQLTSAFPYDSGNNLVAADKRGYLYDPAGNLKTRTNNAALEGFTVDVQNQLTSEPSGSSPSYDANGNLIVLPGPTIKTADYDSENQLAQVNSGIFENIGSSYSTCQYDGKMRLRSIDAWRFEEIDPGYYGWVQHESRKFIYDGMEILQERISNSPVATYTRGLDLSGTLGGAGGIGGLLARTANSFSGNFPSYYQADGNGNITFLLNSNGTTHATYRYDAFGNILSETGGSPNRMKFSSKPWIAEVEGYYYGYRFYVPSLQRWLNRDPIQEAGGINIFGFVGNEPVYRIDPDGRIFPAILVGIAVGMAVDYLYDKYVDPHVEEFVNENFSQETQDLYGNIKAGVDIARSIKNPLKACKMAGSRVNKVRPQTNAPHTAFKRGTDGRVNGYTEFDAAGNPVKRFRGTGGPHGGQVPPLILEPRPGKGPGSTPIVPRPPNADELPIGY